MDEEVLNELLECSVCLEHMDTSSKVLPCQHTFHRHCLENIISTKGELKCPECRTIVSTRPEHLPPNILLMRLLETVRNVSPSIGLAMSSTSASGPTFSLAQKGPVTNTVTGAKSISKSSSCSEPCAKALYNYDAKEAGDLTFKKSDVILLRKKVDENWYHGDCNNQQGFFPASYVQVITPLPDNTPRCKALYDFEMDDSEKDCLTFHKDEVLTIIRRVDSNWVEGKRGDKIGIFPISFVEMNEAAKHLINRPAASLHAGLGDGPGPDLFTTSHMVISQTVPKPRFGTGGDVTMGPSQQGAILSIPCRNGTGPCNGIQTTGHATQAHNAAAINTTVTNIAQHKKRLSLTALNNHSHNSPPPIQQRHSMEISSNMQLSLAPTLTTTPSPTSGPAPPPIPAHQITSPRELSSSSSKHLTNNVTVTTNPVAMSTDNCQSQALPTSVGLKIFVALYNYKPQKDDEVELKKGEYYSVTEKCQDGWCKGMCYRTGKIGVFPGNYVQQVKIAQTSGKPSQLSPGSSGSSNVMNVRAVGPASLATSTVPISTIMSIANPQSLEYKVRPGVTVPPQRAMPPNGGSAINPQTMTVSQAQQLRAQQSSVQHHVSSSSAFSVHQGSSGKTVTVSHMESHELSSVSKGHSSHGPRPELPLPPRGVINKPLPVIPPVSYQALTSASTDITAPNVVVGGALGGVPSMDPSTTKDNKREKKDREKMPMGLMKRLTGGSKAGKKLPRAPPSAEEVSGAIASCSGSVEPVHARAISLPMDDGTTNTSQHTTDTSQHKKTGSLDLTGPQQSGVVLKPSKPKPPTRQRCKCIVPFPPNSEFELELKIGDIVFVHKKRDDGWYKGTLQRTGKTGLFPGSFVETCSH